MMTLKQSFLVLAYLRSIKKRLHYPLKSRKRTIKELRGFIYGRILAGDQVNTMQDLYDLFGTPERAAEQWMELITEEEYIKYHKEVRIKRAVLISFFVILLIVFIFFFWNYISKSQLEIVSRTGTLPDTGEGVHT